MKIYNIIEKRIDSLKLYDKNGQFVNSNICKQEYLAIKNQLLSNFIETDIIGIQFEKDYRYMLTLLACMSIGLPYIPLSVDWPNERIKQIEELSGCSVIREKDFNYSNRYTNLNKRFNNEILYIIFTSGSTGAPKGVQIPRTAYENFLEWADIYFANITSNDRMLLTTDFTFDISLVDISLILTKNLSLYISNFNNNIFKLLYEIETYRITVHSTVPYNYSMIMHDDVYSKANLSTLKHIMIGGARFPNNLYNHFKERLPSCNIYNFYGPTEATIYCSIQKFKYQNDELYKNNITIGKPFYNNRFTVIDDELYISGPQLMRGYLNNPQKTQEALVTIENTTYYKSGDVVFKNSLGNYFIVGRKDDTIKVTGYRVNLSDIDSYILKLDYISNVATIAIENEASEHNLISYVILTDTSIDSKIIKQDLKDIMPNYQIPKIIKIVEAFPLNNSGKICKISLKNNYLNKTKDTK